jgi:hypothetical protein
MRSGKRLKILTLFTMLMYMLCGLSLFFLSQTPSFASDTITSDTHYLSTLDVISSEEETSKDGKFKYAVPAYTISQYIHPDNKEDRLHGFISVFLKQITLLHYSLRSPPISSS